MALTSRAKKLIGAGTAVAVGVVLLIALVASGNAPEPIERLAENLGVAPEEPPSCPLTALKPPGGEIPGRPALAVKIENSPSSRPQAGLNAADIVFEEPVEGGLTRFIAVYQCRDADRIGPVRSGRLTDPDVLVQFGRPPIAYSGGVQAVRNAIARAGLVDVGFETHAEAYERDPNRSAPHDIFTTTEALYGAADAGRSAPTAVFTHGEDLPERTRRGVRVHLPFSPWSDVFWEWDAAKERYVRSHGAEGHVMENGQRVVATNVVVMLVEVRPGKIVDVNGVPSPEVQLTGRGRAYVLRDGRLILGRWERSDLDDPTRLVTRDGGEIALAPGTTWVELFPNDLEVQVGSPS